MKAFSGRRRCQQTAGPRHLAWHHHSGRAQGRIVVIAGDGQVSMGQTIVKANAKKVRRLGAGDVLGGFAGATADAFTLFERLEAKLEQYPGPADPRLRRPGQGLAHRPLSAPAGGHAAGRRQDLSLSHRHRRRAGAGSGVAASAPAAITRWPPPARCWTTARRRGHRPPRWTSPPTSASTPTATSRASRETL